METYTLQQQITQFQECQKCWTFKQEINMMQDEFNEYFMRIEKEKLDYIEYIDKNLDEVNMLIHMITQLDQKMANLENYVIEKQPDGQYLVQEMILKPKRTNKQSIAYSKISKDCGMQRIDQLKLH
jgi:predicted nuclease with TOPRIM domain